MLHIVFGVADSSSSSVLRIMTSASTNKSHMLSTENTKCGIKIEILM
jgi:hypothetical protein